MTIKLTAEEVSAIECAAIRYASVEAVAKYMQVFPDGHGEMIQGQAVLDAIDILREQGLTKDSGLNDPHDKYTFGMFPLLSAELSNQIFEGVDYGEIHSSVHCFRGTFGLKSAVDAFPVLDDPVFSVEQFDIYDEDKQFMDFELWVKCDAIATRYALDACIERIKNAVEGVSDDE